jgi:ribosome-associated toxin RatA of RatAB toxin-antitoxin module
MSHKVMREVVIDAPIERFFALVMDLGSYPQFVPGVKACHPRPPTANGTVDAEYEVDVGVKTIRYVLRHVPTPPVSLTWSLVSGDWMKVLNGAWELADVDGKTRARYSIEVQVAKPALVPQSVVDKVSDELAKVQLHRVLDAFKARAEGR